MPVSPHAHVCRLLPSVFPARFFSPACDASLFDVVHTPPPPLSCDSRPSPPPADGDGGMVDCARFGVVSALDVASTLTSMSLALWWLVVRNTAGYAWVLQVPLPIRSAWLWVMGVLFVCCLHVGQDQVCPLLRLRFVLHMNRNRCFPHTGISWPIEQS